MGSLERDTTPTEPHTTELIAESDRHVKRVTLTVVDGPDAGGSVVAKSDRLSLGSHPSNDLVLKDPAVSRFHCEVQSDDRGARVRDLGSLNGTSLDGVFVLDAYLRDESILRLGRTVLRFQFAEEPVQLPLSAGTGFGSLVGGSVAMRTVFALLERAAATEVTVILEGETGTGKEGAAEAVHDQSTRRDGPFVVVDCGAIPVNLLESELFGHEKGAFTGAVESRSGAFEDAHGGTIFLDEIGELPLELQPKLLRVLEQREIRRVGSTHYKPIDVRLIAATNRDLRAEVNAGRFRADLYFRLAVVNVRMPPLRAVPEDLPALARHILATLDASASATHALLAPDFVAKLALAAWPGNVRELRNYLERCLVMEQPLPIGAGVVATSTVDPKRSYADARQAALLDFERRYVESLLQLHQGRIAEAARAAGMDRRYLYRLMERHRIKR